jgi:hypothetical protein
MGTRYKYGTIYPGLAVDLNCYDCEDDALNTAHTRFTGDPSHLRGTAVDQRGRTSSTTPPIAHHTLAHSTTRISTRRDEGDEKSAASQYHRIQHFSFGTPVTVNHVLFVVVPSIVSVSLRGSIGSNAYYDLVHETTTTSTLLTNSIVSIVLLHSTVMDSIWPSLYHGLEQ